MTEQPPNEIREAAIKFEARKLRISQDMKGVVLVLSVHPNEVPKALFESPALTRYMCALVELNDEDMVVTPQGVIDGKQAVGRAGMLCRNQRFQDWMVRRNYAFLASEEQAVQGLYDLCGIKSRAELAINEKARIKFSALIAEFEKETGF